MSWHPLHTPKLKVSGLQANTQWQSQTLQGQAVWLVSVSWNDLTLHTILHALEQHELLDTHHDVGHEAAKAAVAGSH